MYNCTHPTQSDLFSTFPSYHHMSSHRNCTCLPLERVNVNYILEKLGSFSEHVLIKSPIRILLKREQRPERLASMTNAISAIEGTG